MADTGDEGGVAYERAVAEWLRCHRATLECTKQLAALRERRQRVAEYLLRQPNRLMPDDRVRVVERNRYDALTFGFLHRCLDECIEDKAAVSQLFAYVKSRRECAKVRDLVATPRHPPAQRE